MLGGDEYPEHDNGRAHGEDFRIARMREGSQASIDRAGPAQLRKRGDRSAPLSHGRGNAELLWTRRVGIESPESPRSHRRYRAHGGVVGSQGLGQLNCAPPAAILDGVITMYRAYRDSWRALELRRPLVSDLIRGAGFMLGFVVGGVLLGGWCFLWAGDAAF